MFAIPFPMNVKPGTLAFVGSVIGNLTLPQAPTAEAYSPVNRYMYFLNASSVYVCDISGTPSLVSTITLAATGTMLAYLPNSNKVYVQEGSHKYQLIDCTNDTAASQVTMTNTFTSSAYICGSFSVDQSNDDVYLGTGYQLGRVVPATGAITRTGFGTTTYLTNMASLSSLAYNNADGYLYIASNEVNHALIVVDPASWNSDPAKHDFGSTPTNIVGGQKIIINRFTGHVYISANSGPKLYVMTDYQTLLVIVPTAQTKYGDYDSVLKQIFEVSGATPGFISVYSTSDAELTRTSIALSVANNPLYIYAAPEIGRYAIQKGTSGEILQIIAR